MLAQARGRWARDTARCCLVPTCMLSLHRGVNQGAVTQKSCLLCDVTSHGPENLQSMTLTFPLAVPLTFPVGVLAQGGSPAMASERTGAAPDGYLRFAQARPGPQLRMASFVPSVLVHCAHQFQDTCRQGQGTRASRIVCCQFSVMAGSFSQNTAVHCPPVALGRWAPGAPRSGYTGAGRVTHRCSYEPLCPGPSCESWT